MPAVSKVNDVRVVAVGEPTPSQPSGGVAVTDHDRWRLVLPHRDRLLRMARRRLPTMEDAEDCVHEALIRAACFGNLDPSRVGPFLSAIVVRLCIDEARARSVRQRALARSYDDEIEPSPEQAVCDHAEATWMMARLDDELSGRERDIMQARVRGFSTRQAAHRLDMSGKAAEAAFTRARARMRALAA